jgi:hypothetical protein
MLKLNFFRFKKKMQKFLPPKKPPIHTVKSLCVGEEKDNKYPVLKKKERVFTPKPPNKTSASKESFPSKPNIF